MTRFLSLIAIVAAIATGPVCAQSITSRDADEAAIRGMIVDMTKAFNNHDAQAATAMYTTDGDFVSVRGETAHGAPDAESKLAAIFATRGKEAMLSTLDVRVRFIRADVALAHVINELSGLVAADGQRLPAHQELSLRVFVKDDGKWQVSAFHNTLIRPFEAATSK